MPSLDLSLPDSIPEMEEYQHDEADGKPFAVYALAATAAADMKTVCRVCDAQLDEEVRQLRPAPVTPSDRFVGKPLRDVLEYHRSMIQADSSWDRSYFAVATRDDWETKGMLLVTLSADGDFQPDILYVPAKEVGITLINLQMVNTDWMETWDGYEDYHLARISEDSDCGGDNEDTGIVSESERELRRRSQEPCFAVYNGISPPESSHSVLDKLDPDWTKKYWKSGEHFINGLISRDRPYMTESGQWDIARCDDTWSEAIISHPITCKRYTRVSWHGKNIDRNMSITFFVYCNETFKTNGTVSLVRVAWDGDILGDLDASWEVIARTNAVVSRETCRAEDAYERLVALERGSSGWRGEAAEYVSDCTPAKPSGFSHWL